MSLIGRCALYEVSAIEDKIVCPLEGGVRYMGCPLERTKMCVLYREACAICGVRYRGQHFVSFVERCALYGLSAMEDKIVCPL